MTRSEFINDLRSKIWNLPVDEVSAAVRYYDNFIVGAGVENEQAIIAKLGSPQRVADSVIREFNSSSSSHDYSNTNPAKDYTFDNNTQNSANQNGGYNNTNQSGGYYNANQNGSYNNSNQNGGYNYSNQNQYRNNGYQTKRLFKSENDKMICGVCGGLAEYFNIDPSLVRIIAVVTAFAGAGLLAYLVGAIILPEKSRL
ncbi:MAG: PspC domain protein [Clostridiales bacterium]|jgi:phage shock protein C|nr:PspC domain protein [Clostridiales bacterium]